MLTQFLNAIGWRNLDSTDLLVLGSVAGGLFVITAWIADVLMERLSLGIVLNVAVMVVGATLGLFGLVMAGFTPTRADLLPVLFASGLGAMTALVAVASFKRTV
jgi:uncharacterized membrane protein YeaQ/YmgE (transglycosylase-associated protein family)